MSQTETGLWPAHLKAWMMTVPKRMKRAEKMSDRMGIISRLEGRNVLWLKEGKRNRSPYQTTLPAVSAETLRGCIPAMVIHTKCIMTRVLTLNHDSVSDAIQINEVVNFACICLFVALKAVDGVHRLTSLSREGHHIFEGCNHMQHSSTE